MPKIDENNAEHVKERDSNKSKKRKSEDTADEPTSESGTKPEANPAAEKKQKHETETVDKDSSNNSNDSGLIKEHDHTDAIKKILDEPTCGVEECKEKDLTLLHSEFWRKGDIPASHFETFKFKVPVYVPSDKDTYFGESPLENSRHVWLEEREESDDEEGVYDSESEIQSPIIWSVRHVDFLKLGSPCLPDGQSNMLIRKDYIELYDLINLIKDEKPDSRGVVVKGQPGIGASLSKNISSHQ